ncbi:hypothetical protein M0811_02858 [Anaeramoeba ignava]|uniref:Phosphatidic acid phosphatase type 2/haloperoxidase domain-containing protein n=1 Tax=Anaeramoeba ignava TaxID=1746090 RepID=A0A9Q0LAE2_ANAIG|nr:hypothetical protein M0811_02858 [Anaeramoeba ignava]
MQKEEQEQEQKEEQEQEQEQNYLTEDQIPLINPQNLPQKFSKKPTHFYFEIPERFTNFFRKFDLAIIDFCQRFDSKFIFSISYFITCKMTINFIIFFFIFNLHSFSVLTSIEIGLSLPFIFFIFRLDGIAIEFSYLMLLYSFISQIPKRFLWRSRPWMVGDAKKVRKDLTSSFPSRAVSGAVVYGFLLNYITEYFKEDDQLKISWIFIIVVIFLVLWASFSRINFGVHYPSDCIFGAIQGLIICAAGYGIYRSDNFGCSSCSTNDCYAQKNSNHVIDWYHLKRAHWLTFFVSTIACFIITLIAISKPLEFWVKCQYVFGQLFPVLTFHFTFLCKEGFPGYGNSLSNNGHNFLWYSIVICIISIPIQFVSLNLE